MASSFSRNAATRSIDSKARPPLRYCRRREGRGTPARPGALGAARSSPRTAARGFASALREASTLQVVVAGAEHVFANLASAVDGRPENTDGRSGQATVRCTCSKPPYYERRMNRSLRVGEPWPEADFGQSVQTPVQTEPPREGSRRSNPHGCDGPGRIRTSGQRIMSPLL